MNPKHPPELPRLQTHDWRGVEHPWARAITRELRALWLPPESLPTRVDAPCLEIDLDAVLRSIWNK